MTKTYNLNLTFDELNLLMLMLNGKADSLDRETESLKEIESEVRDLYSKLESELAERKWEKLQEKTVKKFRKEDKNDKN